MTFSNFTEKAREAINCAHQAACELGHGYIGSEHILLGLLREGTGVAARALAKAGVSEQEVLAKIKEAIGTGAPLAENADLSLTPRSKRILEISAMEARRLGHNYIGTEHLLMAIIRDGDGVAAQILSALGVRLNEFYSETVNAIDSEPLSSASPQAKRIKKNTKTPTLEPVWP